MRALVLVGLVLFALAHGQMRTYRAAAVQFTRPAPLGTAGANIRQVLDQFWQLAAQASAQGAQLVLFPEASIWGYADYQSRSSVREYAEHLPEAQPLGSVPACLDGAASPQLQALSCMALKFNMTVAANMADVQPCPTCNDSHAQFNTEVVLDSSGVLLAKYHKTHIYSTAPGFDQPGSPDPVYFDASFGVRFGLLICYDIDFEQPAQQLIRSHGVRSFLLSTSWGNIPPLNTALLTQQGWARAAGVNLIAANNGASPMVAGGGLIRAGGQVLASSFGSQSFNTTTVLVAELPCDPRGEQHEPPPLPAALAASSGLGALPEVCTVQIDGAVQTGCHIQELSAGAAHELQASHNSLECRASLQVHSSTVAGSKYALIALNTTLRFPHTPDPLGLQVCALVQCQGAPACGPSWSAHAVLSNFSVAGNFAERTVVVPMVGVRDAQPVPPGAVGFSRSALWSLGFVEQPLWGATLYGTLDHTV